MVLRPVASYLGGMSITATIRDWFDREFGGSLQLPDGLYGKPFDNQHSLTQVSEVGDETTLVLDELITLRFQGLAGADVRTRDLVLGPFRKLSFTARPYGSAGNPISAEYDSGEVRIVSAPG